MPGDLAGQLGRELPAGRVKPDSAGFYLSTDSLRLLAGDRLAGTRQGSFRTGFHLARQVNLPDGSVALKRSGSHWPSGCPFRMYHHGSRNRSPII